MIMYLKIKIVLKITHLSVLSVKTWEYEEVIYADALPSFYLWIMVKILKFGNSWIIFLPLNKVNSL